MLRRLSQLPRPAQSLLLNKPKQPAIISVQVSQWHDPMQGRWEHFEHIADIGVRGRGETCEAAFEMGALALSATLSDPSSIQPLETIELTCTAPNEDLLFMAWLNAIIYEMDVRKMIFAKFHTKIGASKDGNLFLQGHATGEPLHMERHQPAVLPKGATATELRVIQKKDNVGNTEWIAQCVIDV